MNKERDLLPWILGGLSAAAIAVAFGALSNQRTAPTPSTPMVAPPMPAPRVSMPAPAAPQAVQTVSEPDAAPLSAPPPLPAAAPPQAREGQIWECTTNGVKTFSNNPCGDKSALLEVGPVNGMSPAPAMHYARAYLPEQRYAPGSDQSTSADAEDYSEQYGADTGANYTIVQGVGFVPRRRPEHFHRPPAHHDLKPARRY